MLLRRIKKTRRKEARVISKEKKNDFVCLSTDQEESKGRERERKTRCLIINKCLHCEIEMDCHAMYDVSNENVEVEQWLDLL